MYIKHLKDGANIKTVTSNEICSRLTGLLSDIPDFLIFS